VEEGEIPAGVVDLRSDTVTRPTAEMRRPWRRPRSGTMCMGKTRRSTVGETRRGDFWERSGAVCADGVHGESHRDQGVDASWQ